MATNDAQERALGALWAVHADASGLTPFDSSTLMDADSVTREDIVDLITDLMHLADAIEDDHPDGTEGEAIVENALMHYHAERGEA